MKMRPYRLEISEAGTFWYGQDFRESMEEAHGPLKTDWDFLQEYRSSLPKGEQEMLDAYLTSMSDEGSGVVPIEIIADRLYTLPFVRAFIGNRRLVPFTKVSGKPEAWDLRASELTASCALDVHLKRQGLVPVTEQARKRMREGQFGHYLSLKDPAFADFLPYYYPDWGPMRRGEYCEKSFSFEAEGLVVEATPDALFQAGDRVIVVDNKTGFSTPSEPHKRYARQVTCYALGIEKTFGMEAMGVLAYFKVRTGGGFKLMDFDITPRRRDETIQFLRDLRDLPGFGTSETISYKDGKEKARICKSCMSKPDCDRVMLGDSHES